MGKKMNEKMKAALTGTPGTGKSTVAQELREEGYRVLDLNQFIEDSGLRGKKDVPRDTYEVDIPDLREEFSKKRPSFDIVEGHLSHYLDLPITIVLRCDPRELRERMKTKDWHKEKIEENIMAEALDVILKESMDEDGQVYEIDTTEKSPSQVMECVKKILDGQGDDFKPGDIDWSLSYI